MWKEKIFFNLNGKETDHEKYRVFSQMLQSIKSTYIFSKDFKKIEIYALTDMR